MLMAVSRMAAKKKKPSYGDIDWYLISIDRLKKIGLALLVIGLAGGAYFYYAAGKNPPQRAARAISDAQDMVNELAASKELARLKTDFDRSNKKLAEAKRFFDSKSYQKAEASAIESQTIAQAAISQSGGSRDSDAQFLTVEGDVSYQKAATSDDWRKADARAPLFNGDWVKTGDKASAELIFSNGSLYTIGPNALLEIYSTVNPQTSRKQNTVQMQVGSVEINTTDEVSTVKTPGTQVVINSDSTAQVGVDPVKNTQVLNVKGSAQVSSPSGGPPVTLSSGDLIKANREGAIAPVTRVLMPPALLSPADNQVYQASADLKIGLVWGEQPQATAYQLQVSRSRLFATLEINARRPQPKATTRVTDEGVFYWRIASVDARGQIGPFSVFRRFRVSGLGSVDSQNQDKVPPTLVLKRPFNIGGQFYMIEGKVEPGASIFINDEEIDVESDGAFKKLVSFSRIGLNTVIVKAVDPAGNQTIQRENVNVQD